MYAVHVLAGVGGERDKRREREGERGEERFKEAYAKLGVHGRGNWEEGW